MRKISKKRQDQLKEYRKLKLEYYENLRKDQEKAGLQPPKSGPWCEVCIKEGWKPEPATDIHHKEQGRGTKTTDTSIFLAVSRRSHDLIHFGATQGYGPKWARERGYLV